VDSRTAGAAACNAGSAGIADMSTMGARIQNGCIGRFGNTRAEQVSPPTEPPPANTPYRLVWSPWIVSPSCLASSPPCCGALNCSIRRAIRPGGTAAWSDEETRICRMRFENR
jgi:hypothetical protein